MEFSILDVTGKIEYGFDEPPLFVVTVNNKDSYTDDHYSELIIYYWDKDKAEQFVIKWAAAPTSATLFTLEEWHEKKKQEKIARREEMMKTPLGRASLAAGDAMRMSFSNIGKLTFSEFATNQDNEDRETQPTPTLKERAISCANDGGDEDEIRQLIIDLWQEIERLTPVS